MGTESNAVPDASATPGSGSVRRPLALLALGTTATLVAWGVLVFIAIDFGKEARSGEPEAWIFLVLAALGATACLFLALLLGARAFSLVRGRPQPPPRPLGGRRRKVD